MAIIQPEQDRYAALRQKLCPGCPLFLTCAQFAEQLDACADAEQISRDIEEAFSSPEHEEFFLVEDTEFDA